MKFLLFLQQQGWIEWIHYYISQGTGDWMPRAHCVAENPLVMLLHIFAEALIGISYFSIPLILWYVAKVQAKFFNEYRGLILLFASFIFLCGATHFTGIVMFWYPVYWFDGLLKLITGVVSFFTAISLVKLAPTIIKLPSHNDVLKEHTRAEAAERRCKYLEDRMSAWTDYTGQHIEALRKEHEKVNSELRRRGIRRNDIVQ